MKTLRLPIIPILIAYLLGLFIGHFDLPIPSILYLILIPFLFFFTILFLLCKKLKLSSFGLLFLFLLLGIYSIYLYLHPPLSPIHIAKLIGPDPIVVEGTVHRSPQRAERGTQILIKSNRIILRNRSFPAEGYLLLFLEEKEVPIRYGDHLRVLCRLRKPKGFRNLGGFNYERYLAFQRIYTIGFLPHGKEWVKIGMKPSNPLLLRIEIWREHIRDFLRRESPLPSSSIFQALVLGEQGNIPEEVKELFITSGIAHLLAISGNHLGIVALLSFSLFYWILKRSEFLLLSISLKKLASLMTIPWILLYAFIAGGRISVIRATIMVIVLLLSILFDRERNLIYSLALAAFIILLFSPPSLFDVSFQLSFLAVISILYLVPRILKNFNQKENPLSPKPTWTGRILRYVKISILATTVAILGTAPFVILHFNRFSLVGFLTNLFAIPWVCFLIVPLSLIVSFFSFFFYPLACLMINLNVLLNEGLLRGVTLMASLPYASIYLPTPTGFEIILFYLLLFLTVQLRKRRIRFIFVVISLILGLNFVYWGVKDKFRKDLQVTFLDVGHGDSILIELPKGKKMLIDGGGIPDGRFDIGKNVIAPFLWKKRIKRVDILVLTHPDPDHLKGLNFVASNFSLGEFWTTVVTDNSEAYVQLKKTLREKGIPCLTLNEETPQKLIHGVEIGVLNPPSSISRYMDKKDSSVLNNSSLVLRFKFKEVVFLFTGDIEQEAEERMVKRGYPLKTHVLKIPHHGSASSSSKIFLEKVRPLYAILSGGIERKGLPHPEVLQRYLQLGSILFRTDEHGAIEILTNGERIEIRSFCR
ncbi:MAG: DNA internalization-related competence protein ComEC/Rec2 [Thermodesulfobacteriota bacterium]